MTASDPQPVTEAPGAGAALRAAMGRFPTGVTVEDRVMISAGTIFVNDRYPMAVNDDGTPQGDADWEVVATRVGRRASIGSGAVILCGVTIGEGALVGAGSVVTKDVPPHTIVAGNPARVLRRKE